jgi:hypothetical protein
MTFERMTLFEGKCALCKNTLFFILWFTTITEVLRENIRLKHQYILVQNYLHKTWHLLILVLCLAVSTY